MQELVVIMVVEDDQLIQTLIEDALTEGGFEPSIATSGAVVPPVQFTCELFQLALPAPPAVPDHVRFCDAVVTFNTTDVAVCVRPRFKPFNVLLPRVKLGTVLVP